MIPPFSILAGNKYHLLIGDSKGHIATASIEMLRDKNIWVDPYPVEQTVVRLPRRVEMPWTGEVYDPSAATEPSYDEFTLKQWADPECNLSTFCAFDERRSRWMVKR